MYFCKNIYKSVITNALFLAVVILSASACATAEKVRRTTDIVVATQHHYNVEALVQAEIERQRLRKLRCFSPFLNPASVSGAALHPNLGKEWVDELLRDCPEYSAFIAELVLRRATEAGVTADVKVKRPGQ